MIVTITMIMVIMIGVCNDYCNHNRDDDDHDDDDVYDDGDDNDYDN